MSTGHSRFYTECGHTITEDPDPAEPNDLSGTQEVIRGRCLDCPDSLGYVESGIEPLPTAPIVAYVRSIRGRAKKMLRSLRSSSSDTKAKEDQGSAQMTSVASGSNMDEEAVGKENIGAKQPIVDKRKGIQVIATGGISNAIAEQKSRTGQDSVDAIRKSDATAGEGAGAKMLDFADHIASNFATMRQKIDTANQRIADINNFNLAQFMNQGVDRWTAAVQLAIQDCEDELIKGCKELAKMAPGPSIV